MMADREAMIEKVRKLWATADHPNTPTHEAASALRMAQDLMAKYEIDEIVLAEASGVEEEISLSSIRITTHDEQGRSVGIAPEGRLMLAHFIARHQRVKDAVESKPYTADVQTGKPIKGGMFLTMVGYRSDIDMVRSLYERLSIDMLEQILEEKVKTANYQENFADGYAVRIDQRLGGVEERVTEMAADHGTSTALVLRSRLDKVNDTFAKMFPNLSTRYAKVKGGYDRNAQERGRQAANVADLGGGRLDSGSRGALGNQRKGLTR